MGAVGSYSLGRQTGDYAVSGLNSAKYNMGYVRLFQMRLGFSVALTTPCMPGQRSTTANALTDRGLCVRQNAVMCCAVLGLEIV